MKIPVMIATVLVLVLGGCSAPNESEKYRDSISVSGFRLVRSDYEKAAFAVYIGPAGSDLRSSVVAPGLVLAPPTTDSLVGIFHLVLSGVSTSDGHHCSVDIYELAPGEGSAVYVGGNLETSERSDLVKGVRIAIRVAVLCEEQADR